MQTACILNPMLTDDGAGHLSASTEFMDEYESLKTAPYPARDIAPSLPTLETDLDMIDIVTVPATPPPISSFDSDDFGHDSTASTPLSSPDSSDRCANSKYGEPHPTYVHVEDYCDMPSSDEYRLHNGVKESLFIEAVAAPPTPLPTTRGRRKALLIGIEYSQLPGKTLDGPHMDVHEIKSFLQEAYKWEEDSFTVLKDDGHDLENQPTKDVMIREFRNLVCDAQEGDSFFLYFSGHGAQVTDLDGDEDDGKDEAIVSSDGFKILDDELHDVLVKPLPARCRLTALFDCCCSGTGLDLPIKLPLVSKDLGADILPEYDPQSAREHEKPVPTRPLMPKRKSSDGDVILWAACQDWEPAHSVEDRYKCMKGAMTHAFIACLRERKKQTYQQLLASISEVIQIWDLCQTPQLSSSQKVDMNEYFSI